MERLFGGKPKEGDVNKYISALFRAEEAFMKELSDYNGPDRSDETVSKVTDIVSGSFFKQLPLKYRLALKLPWKYAVETLTEFLKELGEGSTEDVIMGIARKYMEEIK